MRPSQFLPVLLCTSLASAWSWPDNAADVAALLEAHQEKRAPAVTLGDTNAASANPTETFASSSAAATTSASSAAATTTNSQSSSSGASSGTGSSGKSSGTAKSTSGSSTGGSSSGTGKTTSGGSKTTTKSSTSSNTYLAVGGASMITPNPLSSASYYKIGNYVTFAWNYTSLYSTPSAIDILASCATNSATYTIAMNQSVSASTGAVTWDTGNYQATATQMLLTGTYTLIIYDANSQISATASAGSFGTYDTFTFAMYTPQPYTPLADWVCVTCNGAMSATERQTLWFMAGMATISVITFTSFLGGAGLLF